MKKNLLFSALIFASISAFAQVPGKFAEAKPTEARHVNANPQGGPHDSYGYNMGPPAMCASDFRMACDAISHQTFDSDKFRIANQVLLGHNLSALQARDMALLFTFDDTRVDFAKAAYLKVIDPENYYVIYDAFTFSSSIAEVANYTNSVGFSGGNTWTGSYGGSNGSGHGHGGGHGSGHGGGHGGGYGQNGYYGGSGNVSGSGNGMTYSGGMNNGPVIPTCGDCHNPHAPSTVCESEFGMISGAISRQTFESDKLIVAKQAVGNKNLSSGQVRRLMDLFTFECTKLDFAKWAFRRTWDPENYYVVNDGFTFSSSVRDLDQYIRFG